LPLLLVLMTGVAVFSPWQGMRYLQFFIVSGENTAAGRIYNSCPELNSVAHITAYTSETLA